MLTQLGLQEPGVCISTSGSIEAGTGPELAGSDHCAAPRHNHATM
jgi:hypothetical protein